MREENSQLKDENRKLENIKIDLENHINVVQERLDKAESVGNERALAVNLQKVINEYEANYKPTSRDWTKAKQLLGELKKLI